MTQQTSPPTLPFCLPTSIPRLPNITQCPHRHVNPQRTADNELGTCLGESLLDFYKMRVTMSTGRTYLARPPELFVPGYCPPVPVHHPAPPSAAPGTTTAEQDSAAAAAAAAVAPPSGIAGVAVGPQHEGPLSPPGSATTTTIPGVPATTTATVTTPPSSSPPRRQPPGPAQGHVSPQTGTSTAAPTSPVLPTPIPIPIPTPPSTPSLLFAPADPLLGLAHAGGLRRHGVGGRGGCGEMMPLSVVFPDRSEYGGMLSTLWLIRVFVPMSGFLTPT
ncbi:hypothetical protein PAPYR_480 [Paratrimastix pyriformis]|uniref:Uncharacterized protein n=1 Tax=Paratrimastix pyriformis TaxID=342808 RepID=A0ABQ8V0C2_9EUKA|nr:hypothetical protein PAPYR_480 [Paratrimastix pyriformis]